jgi:hypothetical protein
MTVFTISTLNPGFIYDHNKFIVRATGIASVSLKGYWMNVDTNSTLKPRSSVILEASFMIMISL